MKNLYCVMVAVLSLSFLAQQVLADETIKCVSQQSANDQLTLVKSGQSLTLISDYPSSANPVAKLSGPDVYEFAYDQLGCGRGATLSFSESVAPSGQTVLGAYLSILGNYGCSSSNTYYTCNLQK